MNYTVDNPLGKITYLKITDINEILMLELTFNILGDAVNFISNLLTINFTNEGKKVFGLIRKKNFVKYLQLICIVDHSMISKMEKFDMLIPEYN